MFDWVEDNKNPIAKSENLMPPKMTEDESIKFFLEKFPNIPVKYDALFRHPTDDLTPNPKYTWKTDEGVPYYDCWFYDNCSHGTIVPLSEFLKYYSAGVVGNFIYLRSADSVFLTLEATGHTNFMAILRVLHKLNNGEIPTEDIMTNSIQNWFSDAYDAQDHYLYEALGCYQSSCNPRLYFHKNFEFNAAEYEAFRGFQFDIYDYE